VASRLLKQAGVAALVALVALPAVALADNVWRNGAGNPRHWRDDDSAGFPRGFLYWVDRTGAPWPVFSSAIVWDREPRLDAVYTSNPSACPRHCVAVFTRDLGRCTPRAGLYGITFGPTTRAGHFRERTRVVLNNRCNSGINRAQRREVACHELGHSIGLDHRPRVATCMRDGNVVNPQTTPDGHDFAMLHNRLYAHNDPG
jgi:hypothetical protein